MTNDSLVDSPNIYTSKSMIPKIASYRKLIFAPKILETVHGIILGIFRMFTPKRLNRKSSALGLRSPATPLRGGTPGTPSRLESSTVPIKIFELLKSEIECDILPGGFGLVIHNETIYLWKLKNKLNLCSLPTPAGYTCKPQNVTVVGSSLCYISSTGMGRFWPNVEKSTVWFEFKGILDNKCSI